MLSEKEVTVLEIMSHGEDMLAIGDWAEIIIGLAGKRYVEPVMDKWHRITPAGIVAFEAYERAQYAPVIEGGDVNEL